MSDYRRRVGRQCASERLLNDMVGIDDAVSARIGQPAAFQDARKVISPIQTTGDDDILSAGATHGVQQRLHPDGFKVLGAPPRLELGLSAIVPPFNQTSHETSWGSL